MTRSHIGLGLAIALTLASIGRIAADDAPASPKNEARGGTGTKWGLVICGHPGDDEHRPVFAKSVGQITQGLETAVGIPPKQLTVLFGVDADTDAKSPIDLSPSTVKPAGQATRETITTVVDLLRQNLQPDDSLWVIVLGHASFEGGRSWLNLPGPDLNQEEFGKLFRDIACREQVFAIGAPTSGYYLKALARPGRCVLTATEADLEINEVEFAHALGDALNPPANAPLPDVDDDGAISLFDLYIATTRGVARRYLAENLYLTEHALLDDNGDGRGTEVQRAFLTEEEGGGRALRRRGRSSPPPKTAPGPGRDGAVAKTVRLLLVPAPPRPAETPAEPAAKPEPAAK